MNQPIEMGPYAFAVTRTEKWPASAAVMTSDGKCQPIPTIEIRVVIHLLRDDAAPFTTDFNSFLIADMKFEDKAGNQFETSPVPISPVYRAGRYHAVDYVASAKVDPSMVGVRDPEHLGKDPRDFHLTIGNPSHERTQPRRVAIQLQ